MHALVLKLNNPNSNYGFSKFVVKTVHFAQAHSICTDLSMRSKNHRNNEKIQASRNKHEDGVMRN